MGYIKGVTLDSAVMSIARDIIQLEQTGVAVDVNQTIANWNEKHKIVENTPQLQNDVRLFMDVEKNRQLTSMNVIGYTTYKAERCIEKAKKLMSGPDDESTPEYN